MASEPRTSSLSRKAAAVQAPPAARKRAKHQTAAVPINDTDRNDVLCTLRELFSRGVPRHREDALHELADKLGYQRLGPAIRSVLESDLLTAVRRGILENDGGQLRLLCRSVEDYQREFLKEQFLASLARTWTEREEAIRAFARWLGYSRTGPVFQTLTRSLINGLLREGRIESNGQLIRRRYRA